MKDIIIGNIPRARGTDVTFDTGHNHDLECVSDILTNDIKITQEVISEQNIIREPNVLKPTTEVHP